jgi:hypothetical protein
MRSSPIEQFLEELEQLLVQHYGQDWQYNFDVEDVVNIVLTLPNVDE